MTKNEKSIQKIDRRTLLRGLGVAGVSATALGSMGTVNAQEPQEPVEFRKVQSEATIQQAHDALQTELANKLLSTLNDPDVDPQSATQTGLFLNNSLWGTTVEIPIEYGTLAVAYNGDGSIINAGVKLSRADTPTGIQRKVSKQVGWPDNKNVEAFLTAHKVDQPLVFTRHTTSEETQRAVAATNHPGKLLSVKALAYVGEKSPQGKLQVTQSGGFLTVYEDAVFVLNPAMKNVVQKTSLEELLGVSTGGFSIMVSTCDKKAAVCAIDVILAIPHCAIAGLGCSLTGVGAGACLLLLLSFCAPNLVLIGLSGACTYFATNCI